MKKTCRQLMLFAEGTHANLFPVPGNEKARKMTGYLWPEMFRLVQECKPNWVIAENVVGHVSMGLDKVLSDLESEKYTCWTFIIPACAVNAPHRRDRVWIAANSDSIGLEALRDSKSCQCIYGPELSNKNNCIDAIRRFWETASRTNRGSDGVPGRVDRLRAIGNSVVPQIPELIGRAILEIGDIENGVKENIYE